MIRVCKKEEYVTLVEILRDSFAIGSIDKRIEDKFGKIIGFDWWERKAVDIMRDVENYPSGAYVMDLEGKITGFIITSMEKRFSVGKVHALAIHPEHQGAGFGTRLLKHALKVFKTNGMKLARIEVLEDNPNAYQLYKKLGFDEAAKQVHLVMELENKDR
ncbi:MAG: hypothetical protein A2452_08020 [Candidatus Firestonebacteria bacterium RIFOXYC2_FULL_39_67]|nr:MAG: hypothetical protein A2536_08045 [Candidatus Firestonebacteria bacterium RIFOXYD2_FULL_39_29]OGF52405.1 MAG: hypothetical protein A2497_08550 [Candidatus Firestonebacteria bacterium RifOxyC12_full_39_7]OGF56788.1 MAG: hypothetical protein A2452_08020 [Candidatus Firestonebacteria bacterium RIFOXYC2_FULL_39_67]